MADSQLRNFEVCLGELADAHLTFAIPRFTRLLSGA